MKDPNSGSTLFNRMKVVQTSNSSGGVTNIHHNQDINKQILESGSGQDACKPNFENQAYRANGVNIDFGNNDNTILVQERDNITMNQAGFDTNKQKFNSIITTKKLSQALGPPRKNTQEIDK